MIIVSQDKDAILNFDNIEAIRLITPIEDNKRNLIAIDMLNGERYSVAKYETEERAKEILQEIINVVSLEELKNKTFEEAQLLINFRKIVRYEMPER